MLSTKIKLYLESKGKVWRDEINNKSFLLQNDGSGDYIKTWNVSGVTKPTDSQLNVFDSDKEEKNQVVRNTRKAAYGDIGEQLDEIYKDIDTWKARIKKIKDDNPKE
tara:strand:- start:343 stop:663 length:321 start_codon:yes stop_codon:yes gene_type:complete